MARFWGVALLWLAVGSMGEGTTSTSETEALVHFQQTFLLTYGKQEEGMCLDSHKYRDLLTPALGDSGRTLLLLQPRCAHHVLLRDHVNSGLFDISSGSDSGSSRMLISGVNETDRNVFVSVTVTYKNMAPLHSRSALETCKAALAAAFTGNASALTAAFRQTFSPLNCPAIFSDTGAALVDEGYACAHAGQVRIPVPSGEEEPPGAEDKCEFCPPGEEKAPGTNVCRKCLQGFYKNRKTDLSCRPCRSGYVTRFNGSASDDNCTLQACEAGGYADVTGRGGRCAPCPHGTYQAQRWQVSCVRCPAGLTTSVLGATSQHTCHMDCTAGHQYSNSTLTCDPCAVGYHNDDHDPGRVTCSRCPDDFITQSPGASSVRQCTIRNCTAGGQYRDSRDNTCRDCPRGSWQNRKWQTSCVACAVGQTTSNTASQHPSDCHSVDEQPAGFENNDTVVIAMLAVLVVLVVSNLIVVGYCLCSKKQPSPVAISYISSGPAAGAGDADADILWKGRAAASSLSSAAGSRRGSWLYEDIDLYDIIRDVKPQSTMTATTTFTTPVTSERAATGVTSSAENVEGGYGLGMRAGVGVEDAVTYTEQRKYAVACSAGEKDLVDLRLQASADAESSLMVVATTAAAGRDDEDGDADSEIYDDISNTGPIYANGGEQSDTVWSSPSQILY